MKTNKTSKIMKSIKMATAFLCILGVTTYALLDGVSTASESKEESFLSASSKGDVNPLLPDAINIEETPQFEGKAPFRIRFDSNQFVGPMEKYSWNFGDGEMAEGAVASHTFVSAGKYSVILTAKQKTGQIYQEQISVSVEPKH